MPRLQVTPELFVHLSWQKKDDEIPSLDGRQRRQLPFGIGGKVHADILEYLGIIKVR